MTDIFWLDEESFAKAKGQLRLQLNDVFQPFCIYGLDTLIPGAIEEVLELADDYSKRLRGEVNQPIRVKRKRNTRR